METINVYDFDGTIYRGDSSFHFWLFCLLRRPYIIILLPWQLIGLIFFMTGIFSGAKGKTMFFSFLKIVNGGKMVEKFWKNNESRINSWFLPENRDSDLRTVVCSASPEFLLEPICKKYKADLLIGTVTDIKTGKISGNNCKNTEKIRRIGEQVPNFKIHTMYSDSIPADGPLFDLAENRILVKNGKCTSF